MSDILYDSKGLTPDHFFNNAYTFFGNPLSNITIDNFFVSKFCLLVDFRTLKSASHHGDGVMISDNDLTFEISRKASNEDEVYIMLHIYVSRRTH